MGRRGSIISMTDINRLFSSIRSAQKDRERQALIEEQEGIKKELTPTYSLRNVDFNFETRQTKIEILETRQYRTVERYVTRDYVKYPIYSDWKYKTKIIKKSIKLTNQALETLNEHEDEFIQKFSKEIIIELNNEELHPSWFIKHFLSQEYLEKINKIIKQHDTFEKEQKNKISLYKKDNEDMSESLNYLILNLKKAQSKKKKRENIITKIENSKKNFFKSLFTFFIYNYLISKKRKNKLLLEKTEIENKIELTKQSMKSCQTLIKENKSKIKELKNDIQTHFQNSEKLKRSEYNLFKKKQGKVVPLSINIEKDNSFIPLKKFIGITYEKIIGCYIIHNTENNKYYVGQSKDIFKRLKQHFAGTIPKNIIFAEDYYFSKMENKENLFEIKIIRCETKDELDKTEKELIEFYDACNSGYNGTNGNK